MRIKMPKLARPFKIPLNIHWNKVSIPISAILGALVSLSVWVLVILSKPEGRYLGFCWLSFGMLLYFLYRKKEKITPLGTLEIERVKIPEFKPFTLEKILVPIFQEFDTEILQIACQTAKAFKASLKVLYIAEIPFTLPLGMRSLQSTKRIEPILQRAEAIASEFGVHIDRDVVFSRSSLKSIIDVASSEEFHLIVLGFLPSQAKSLEEVKRLLRKNAEHPIRLWACLK